MTPVAAATPRGTVGGDGRAIENLVELPVDAERELRILFRREAQLERQLADVRNALEQARSRFARSNNLIANPRMELLRTRFGGQ